MTAADWRPMVTEARDPKGRATVVADFMRRDVVSISPSAPIRELAALLGKHRISGVPVVDEDGLVVGTVSVSDLLWLAEDLGFGDDDDAAARRRGRQLLEQPVRSVMTPDVFGMEPDDTLGELAKFFARRGLGRAVVLEEGRVVGIVSFSDLIGMLAEQSESAAS